MTALIAAMTPEQLEEHYRLLIQGGNDLISRFDQNGVISYMSPAAKTILGYAPEEMVGKETWDFIHPGDHSLVRSNYLQIQRQPHGSAPRFEYRVLSRSGEIRTMEAGPKAIIDPATGRIREFFDVARDVTDRKRAESARQAALAASEAAHRELQESEDRYRMLAETARDLTVQFDGMGRIIYASPAARWLGWTPEELTGRFAHDLVHPDHRERAMTAIATYFETRGDDVAGRDEFLIRRKGGDYVWMEGNTTILKDETGRSLSVISSFRDVSDRRQLEDSLIAARLQAEASVAAKAEFLANMSHELRTPLTSVIGYAQLIQSESDLSDPVRRAADRITAGGKALLAVINDVLDFSKIEAGDIQLAPQATPLDPLLREVAELMGLRAQEKGLSLRLSGLDDLPPFVLVDSNRLRQVLFNLVGNAIKFSDQGLVEIAATFDAEAQTLRLNVIDTGPGMSQEQLSHLFQRFRQIDGSVSRRHGGTGLGLAISKGLTEAMGGSIGVESAPGIGSCFSISLPAPVCAPDDPSEDSAIQDRGLSGRRVLVVDDNREVREVVSVILKSFGLDVVVADDGASAVEAAAAEAFDVILMDLRMPVMDGVEITRRIREAKGPNRFTAILMCSADGEAIRSDAAALFDGAILKPVTPANLLGAIAGALDDDPAGLLDRAQSA